MAPPALKAREVKVRSLDVDRVEVSWEVGDTDDIYSYDIEVLRSESPEGPFEPVSPKFTDRYLFVDARVPYGNYFRKLWYVVRITHRGTGEYTESAPVTGDAEPSLDAQYIRRNEMTLFVQVIGRACWLFKKRTFGPRCPSCWDRVMSKRTRANCKTCFDTGFLRGYHDPIEVYVQIDPASSAKQNNPQQITQFAATSGRMSFYPNVSPGDVIVEAENIRWRVVHVTQTERLRAPIRQDLGLHRLSQSDVEFHLPINLDRALRDIQPSPPRMFTNPTTLEGAIFERVPNAFANYETLNHGKE